MSLLSYISAYCNSAFFLGNHLIKYLLPFLYIFVNEMNLSILTDVPQKQVEMQILEPYPRSMETETLGVDLPIGILQSLSGDSDSHETEFEEAWLYRIGAMRKRDTNAVGLGLALGQRPSN